MTSLGNKIANINILTYFVFRDSTVSAIVENSPDMDAENQNIPCVLESAEQSNSGKDESKQDDNPKPLSITKPESPAVLLCPMVRQHFFVNFSTLIIFNYY